MFKTSFLLSVALAINLASYAQDQKAMYVKWIGTYYSTLPCVDCEGIQYVISLSKNRTYVEELVYLGKSKSVFTSTGNYNVSPNGIMSLVKSENGFKYFRKHPDGLRLLDANAKIIDGESAKKYILKTAKNITNSKFITNKYAEETDFYAFGNVDDWELDIDFDKKMTFKTNSDSITANLSRPDTSQDKKTVKYVAKNDSLEFRINIKKDSCRNMLTGERFIYQVEIGMKKKSESNFVQLIGGGREMPDQRLENQWLFKTINNRKIKPKDFPNGAPSFQFNIHESKLNGFSGCNNFEGKAWLEGNTLSCRTKSITETACKQTKIETELYRTLAKKVLTYKIEGSSMKIFEGKNLAFELELAAK